MRLLIAPINKREFYRPVDYMGQVQIYMIGIWRYGLKNLMRILTTLDKIIKKLVYLE